VKFVVALTPCPSPLAKSAPGEGSFLIFSERVRELPSPGALFARGEGQGVRVIVRVMYLRS